MDFLTVLCEKYDIKLVGDSCDSLGSKWNGKHLSSYYVAWSSSFYPAHHISTGEGGICCTDLPDLKKIFTSFSWWGRDCHCVGSANLLSCGTCGNRFDKWLESYDGVIDHKYVFTNMGYNLKPMDLQGSIGLVQLTRFEEIDRKRKESKNRIESILLKYVIGLNGVEMLDKSDTCWFGTPFICLNKVLKDKLVSFLEENKIQTRNYFAGNILMHPGYKHLDDLNLYPNANQVLDKVFFLGAAPHYDEQVFNYIENIFIEKWVN
jgi:CDP-6-deoxy-D-xylo-4-hexulose-3-dehydrase